MMTALVVAVVPAVASLADDGPERDAKKSEAGRLGPPPWAQSHEKDHGRSADKHAWHEAWKQLSPEQKEQRMKELSKAHEEGMRAWGQCVEDAGGDRAKRAKCEKPLPPGLAKKQP